MIRTRLVAPLAAVSAIALVSSGFAQSASAQAEALFRQGKELFAAGKISQACAAFESSQRLEPTAATLFSSATCREKNGQLATAWGAFVELQRQTRDSSDPADHQYNQLAGASVERLEPELSKLTIRVRPNAAIAGLEIHRDGDLVDAGAWNHPLPIDGGTYKITAHAPGHEDWSTTITVKGDADAETVTVQPLGIATTAATHTTDATDTSDGTDATPTPARSYKAPILFGAGALALGAAAVVLELIAEHDNDGAQTAGPTSDGLDEWHTANTYRYTAEGLGIAAVASAGVAIFELVHHPSEVQTPQTARRFEIAPVTSAQLAGLQIKGVW